VRPEDLEERFLDLGCVDGDSLFLHLLHLLLVKLHKFDIGIAFDRLQVVINDLVVTVDAIDVFKQAFQNG